MKVSSRLLFASTRIRFHKMASNLPHIPDMEKLSPSIIRVLGGNPSKFTLQGTNTYLLGTGRRRLLLDTGEGRRVWSTTLSDVLKSEDCTVSTCLLSHWHMDHVGGVKQLQKLCDGVKIYKHTPGLDPDGNLKGQEVLPIDDGQKFSPEGEDFEITAHHTPGHTKDHLVFTVTSSSDSSELGRIFTGDNVLGHGTAVFENLATYLSSLSQMKSLVTSAAQTYSKQGPTIAYPAHGLVIEDALAKIEEYITHRKMREEEALNVLRYGVTKKEDAKEVSSGMELGSMQMVKVIYREYPEGLHGPAEGGLIMVLEKLRGEGRVVKIEDGKDVKWRIGEKATL